MQFLQKNRLKKWFPEHQREPHQGKQYDRDGQIEDVLDGNGNHIFTLYKTGFVAGESGLHKKTKQAQTSIHRVSVAVNDARVFMLGSFSLIFLFYTKICRERRGFG